ncbi:MAG: response regulator [Burkholderiaceae bacterium]
MSRAVHLLVVDDHPLFRRGLVALLETDERFQVSGEAADIGEALRLVRQTPPDVILLDNHLPGVRGVDGIEALREASPTSRILMLTVSESGEDLAAALHAGAHGYLLKTVETDQLFESIMQVVRGESVISPQMTTKLVNAFRSTARPLEAAPAADDQAAPVDDGLSPREEQILALIARGDSNKAIARELTIAETTVKIHVQHILRKLNLTSRVQAAVYAANRTKP